ncbi:MAG TPA: Rad52/Rad22 family DNA repair protein [Gemmatimonadaceae bacterium]|nr:Rad52/Rad22 family DNA repair protein [Gemmatimonadaceae bacterium]
MIARHETTVEKNDIWAQLSAPLPAGVISWRQDGRPVQRDGRYFARFVAYVDANTVRERLDGVVPGEWDLTLELLPTLASDDHDEPTCSFKARLQILGVIREDVGTGRDYKQAATDAFKRSAVRFGIAHELYAYEQNWVQVDGDGRYAKPLEDPADAYGRRVQRATVSVVRADESAKVTELDVEPATGPLASDEPSCPKCGGRMWDNRLSKRNPKAPDFKCRSRSCDGVVWPARSGSKPDVADVPRDENAGLEELPF